MDGAHRRVDASSSDRRHAATSTLPSSSKSRRRGTPRRGKSLRKCEQEGAREGPRASPAADNSPICVHQRLANPHQQRIHHGECSPHLSQLLSHVLPRCRLSLHSLIASSCFASLPALSALYDRLLLSFVCRCIFRRREHRWPPPTPARCRPLQACSHRPTKPSTIDRPNHQRSTDQTINHRPTIQPSTDPTISHPPTPTINHRPTRPSSIDLPDHQPSTARPSSIDRPDHQPSTYPTIHPSTDPDHQPSADPTIIHRPTRPSSIDRPDHQPSTDPTINHRPTQPSSIGRPNHQPSTDSTIIHRPTQPSTIDGPSTDRTEPIDASNQLTHRIDRPTYGFID